MSMRDQINEGITNAVNDSINPNGNPRRGFARLAGLTPREIDAVTEQVLRVLADQPTPDPLVAVAPAATPMLVITPADVVARAAQDALEDRRDDHRSGLDVSLGNPEGFITTEWTPNVNVQGLRRLGWGIHRMFGVDVRSNGTSNMFLACGTRAQIRAIRRAMETLSDIATPLLGGFTPAEVETFWTTVATLIMDNERSRALSEQNQALFTAAREWHNRVSGQANIVGNIDAATSGAIYERAAKVATAAQAGALV